MSAILRASIIADSGHDLISNRPQFTRKTFAEMVATEALNAVSAVIEHLEGVATVERIGRDNPPKAPTPPVNREDTHALDKIAAILGSNNWGENRADAVDLLAEIAEIVHTSGRPDPSASRNNATYSGQALRLLPTRTRGLIERLNNMTRKA